MEMQKGRPAEEAGRMDKEIRTYDFLDTLGVPFDRIDHDPAMTMEDCVEVDKIFGATMCKNLFLCNRQKTHFYLLLIPGDKHFLTRELSGQLGVSRLSFADGEHMQRYLDITPGSVSVMGLMNDKENNVQLVIDRDVVKAEWFACHPCINTSSIRFSMKDFLEKIIPALKHEAVYVDLP